MLKGTPAVAEGENNDPVPPLRMQMQNPHTDHLTAGASLTIYSAEAGNCFRCHTQEAEIRVCTYWAKFTERTNITQQHSGLPLLLMALLPNVPNVLESSTTEPAKAML